MEGFFLSAWFAEAIRWMNSYIGNYAITIIIFTILTKLVLIPLDIKQRKSMRKTTAVQGKVDAIRKKYASDPQKQNAKVQELYKEEGISLTAGCLPLLLQMPIFIALLGAVRIIGNEQIIKLVMFEGAKPENLESFLWVRNIWQPDSGLAKVMPTLAEYKKLPFTTIPILNTPTLVEQAKNLDYEAIVKPIMEKFSGLANGWFILPLLAGGSQMLQTKLMPQGAATQQNKAMLYIMPLVSVYICVISNAAFSLYWLTSNVVSIIFQIVLNKIMDDKEASAAPVGKEEKE